MSYLVKIVDGPAAGWSYVTFVAPDPEIGVAPYAPAWPGETWMRVLLDEPEWPEQRTYASTGAAGLTEHGDIIVEYRVKPDLRAQPARDKTKPKAEISLLALGGVIAAVNWFVGSWWLTGLIPLCGVAALVIQRGRLRRERAARAAAAPDLLGQQMHAAVEELRNTVGVGLCPTCGQPSVNGTFAEGGKARAWCGNGHEWIASVE